MNTVTIGHRSIEISGHAKKAVVCHAISAISNMVGNFAHANGWAYVVANDDGYMKIYDINEKHISSPLFAAMIEALEDIKEEYPGSLEIKYI